MASLEKSLQRCLVNDNVNGNKYEQEASTTLVPRLPLTIRGTWKSLTI